MPHTKRVFDYFENSVIPRLKNMGAKNMLYVGWRHDCKPWWHNYMATELGGALGVLEIFPKNIEDLEHGIWNGKYDVDHIYKGDARDPAAVLPKGVWDVIFWDHGPEHVTYDDLKLATPRLFDHTNKILLYCCPWGEWPQGEEDGNPHEVHRNYVTVPQLHDIGMTVETFAEPGQQKEGELVAWMLK